MRRLELSITGALAGIKVDTLLKRHLGLSGTVVRRIKWLEDGILVDEARVNMLKAAGLHILVYTVNKPQRAAELLRWGVDSICTDAIDVIGPNFSSAKN